MLPATPTVTASAVAPAAYALMGYSVVCIVGVGASFWRGHCGCCEVCDTRSVVAACPWTCCRCESLLLCLTILKADGDGGKPASIFKRGESHNYWTRRPIYGCSCSMCPTSKITVVVVALFPALWCCGRPQMPCLFLCYYCCCCRGRLFLLFLTCTCTKLMHSSKKNRVRDDARFVFSSISQLSQRPSFFSPSRINLFSQHAHVSYIFRSWLSHTMGWTTIIYCSVILFTIILTVFFLFNKFFVIFSDLLMLCLLSQWKQSRDVQTAWYVGWPQQGCRVMHNQLICFAATFRNVSLQGC